MNYLLAISLGPVQDFIAAARRTADLQAGSELLVDLAKTVAETVHAGGKNTLIFPAAPNTDGPNKILVQVNDSDSAQVAALASAAKAAAQQKLVGAWEQTLVALSHLKYLLDEPLADSQIERFLEFYAAWVPLKSDTDYPNARRDVDRLLAGRKALRQFEQCNEQQNQTRRQRQKSPLDPSRDCVIKPDSKEEWRVPEACDARPLWLKRSETLDAVSIVKRVWGVEQWGSQEVESVPSTSLMAARGLLPELREAAPSKIQELEALARKGGKGVDIGDLVFKSRRDEVQKETEGRLSSKDMDDAEDLTHNALRAAGRSEFPPYYAILLADGDRMGKLLSAIDSRDGHREISQCLSDFAKKAEEIVTGFGGHAVYVGGDDVLALLPANRALECAAQLAQTFRQVMTEVAAKHKVDLSDTQKGGTLSAGIVWVHSLEPLQQALEKARDAEKMAKKNGRNSLALAVYTRGGEPRTSVRSWKDTPEIDDWNALIATLSGDLARGFPYELRTLARECHGAGLPIAVIMAEAMRILERKKGNDPSGSAAVVKAQLEEWMSNATEENAPCKLEEFAQKLVIARFLADWQPRSHVEQKGRPDA